MRAPKIAHKKSNRNRNNRNRKRPIATDNSDEVGEEVGEVEETVDR